MPRTTPTTSLATVNRLARRAATVCTAVIVLSLAAASCATDEPLPVAPLPAAEQPSEAVVGDDPAEIVANDDGLDPAPTTTFVADNSPVEAADTSGDAEPDPETAPAEPPPAEPAQEPATPEQEIAAPVTTIPETPDTTVPSEPCPDGEHPDGSGGCHPDHDDVTPTTTTPTTTTPTTTTPTTTTPTTTTPTTTTPTTTTPTTTTPTTTVAPDENDPWERIKHEPVLASELHPEEDLPDNLWCGPGETGCWTEPDEPEPDPGEVWVHPQAGDVPTVHPDTETSWQKAEWNLDDYLNDYDDLANDHPRPTPNVAAWAASCLGRVVVRPAAVLDEVGS